MYSYLSRVAATWRTGTVEFAHDIGAPFKYFLEEKPEAFDALATWANLTSEEMDTLLSWTGQRIGDVRMKFRGEVIVSRALRNPQIRGCPVCLREDAGGQVGPAIAAMVMRGDWQLREAVLCIRHGHPLVTLWTVPLPRDRNDIAARLALIEDDILSGALDVARQTPSSFDLWLDARLEDGRDDSWFRAHPLRVGAIFCPLLGAALRRADGTDCDATPGADHAAGFEAARHGSVAIRDAFDRIAAAATGTWDGPNKAFGQLYMRFSQDLLHDDAFAPLLDLMRDCIFKHWPIAPDTCLLGKDIATRKLHSVVTAAEETRLSPDLVEQVLVEFGVLSPDDPRPRGRRLFDAQAWADLLKDLPELVGLKAMRAAIGATEQEFDILTREGVLTPFTRVANTKRRWRIADGVALVDALARDAISVSADDDAWETLLNARRRAGVSLAALIRIIRDGGLPVGRRAGNHGFHAIVVPIARIEAFSEASPDELSPRSDLLGSLSVSGFGRSIGLRDTGYLVSLVEAGHTPALPVLSPSTGRTTYRFRPADIAAFHDRFVTLTSLSAATNLHRNTLKTRLLAFGVTPFTHGECSDGTVYLRTEAFSALAPSATGQRDVE